MQTSTPEPSKFIENLQVFDDFCYVGDPSEMPNKIQKSCPNGFQNRPKINCKSIRKPMQNFNVSWHRFLIDFGLFWAPRRASKSFKINEKSILGAHGDPKALKTHQIPSQDPPKIENRPQIDPKSAKNPINIDPKTIKKRSWNIHSKRIRK